MDCSQFRKYLDNYENLDDLQLKMLYDHAEVCEECRRELEFFNSIMKTVASVPVPEMPVDFIEQVNKKIDAQPEKKGFIYNFSVISKRYAAVAACVAIGLVVGLNKTDIEDKLNGNDDSGVIQSVVTTAVPASEPIPVASTPAAEEAEVDKTETVAEVTVKPTVKPEPTIKPTTKPTPKVTPKPTVKPAEKSTPKTTIKPVVKATVKPTVKPTDKPAIAVVTQTVTTATPEAKPDVVATQSPQAVTEKTVDVNVVSETEVVEKNYTIAQEYYVPESENITAAVTAEPDVNSYSLATAQPQTQYSYKEQATPTPAVPSAIADYVLVSEADVDAVATILLDLGIASARGLYMTETNTFYEFLARLEDRNISYDYSMKYTTGDKISFKILLR